MVFDINGKVALITGGGSGLGLKYAQELLKHQAKGVVLADINETIGELAVTEIEKEFGKGKAVFVKTDVTNIKQFENAFHEAVEVFKQIDVLFNNAGIMNDAVWDKEIAININGTINGMLLGMENYLPKYKSAEEAVIVNISSTAGIEGYPHAPIYVGTKFAVHGMTLAWGAQEHYNRTKVRVVALAPGVTDTPLIRDLPGRMLSSPYEDIRKAVFDGPILSQTPDELAALMIPVLRKAPSGTVWVVEGAGRPYQYVMADRFNLEKKIYLDE